MNDVIIFDISISFIFLPILAHWLLLCFFSLHKGFFQCFSFVPDTFFLYFVCSLYLVLYTMSAEAATPAAPARRVFRTFEYRGVELDKLLTLSEKQVYDMFCSRARRNRARQVQVKHQILMKKVLKAKKEAVEGEKPATVNTHCRNKIITPQMIGSVIGIYNGKCFNAVEIKPEMIGHYLGEFSLTYTPVRHGRPGVGATHSSRFVPLK